MTYRQLILELLRDCPNLDAPAEVLIFHRDEKLLAVRYQRVPIMWVDHRPVPGLAVEASAVATAPTVRT